MRLMVFLFLLLAGHFCNHPGTVDAGPYRLSDPDEKISLPFELKEISGLTYHQGALFAIQDEEGILFRISLSNHEITSYPFTEPGDFECLESDGENIYIMTSKGRWYKVWFEGDELKAEKQDKFISKDKNIEGMGFIQSSRTLLIAGKESPKNDKKDIYAIQLDSISLDLPLYFKIDQDQLRDSFYPGDNSYTFNPSGIAYEPNSGWLYILSHPDQQILILNELREIEFISRVPTHIFPQPEGICFDQEGNLYVSSEAPNDLSGGKIFKFMPRK